MFLSITTFVFSQNSGLDEKNGFKDFQLGDSISKWSDHLISKGNGKYIYTGTCCQQVFSYDVSEIGLVFEENILVNILITLDQWEKPVNQNDTANFDICFSNWQSLVSRFNSMFGKNQFVSADENGNGIFSAGWMGKNVALTCGFEFEGTWNGCKPFVFIGRVNKNDGNEGF